MDQPSDLVRTGQAAALLGCSRQHIVDLCTSGALPSVSVGTHRRIRRADVEAFGLRAGRSALRPEAARSMWLHRAVAGKLARDPERVLERARRNLDRMERVHAQGMSHRWLDRWRTLVEEGPETVMRVLAEDSAEGIELRQNSPFAGVLSNVERLAILGAFRRHAGQATLR